MCRNAAWFLRLRLTCPHHLHLALVKSSASSEDGNGSASLSLAALEFLLESRVVSVKMPDFKNRCQIQDEKIVGHFLQVLEYLEIDLQQGAGMNAWRRVVNVRCVVLLKGDFVPQNWASIRLPPYP